MPHPLSCLVLPCLARCVVGADANNICYHTPTNARVKQDLARRSDEWSRQLAAMLKAKASEAQQAMTPRLPSLPLPAGPVDVAGLKAALGGVLAGLLPQGQGRGQGQAVVMQPQQQQEPEPEPSTKKEAAQVAVAAAVEEALAEYQEALDAEIIYVKDQLKRLKREALALEPLLSPEQGQPPGPAAAAQEVQGRAKGSQDDDEEEDEEKEEAALFAANAALAATRRALDPEAVQRALQQLLGERASAAAAVRADAEARVRALLSETTKGVEEVKGRAAATVSWVKGSLQSLQRQARAALPSAPSSSQEQQQEAAPPSLPPPPPSAVPLEEPGVAGGCVRGDDIDVGATFHEDTPGVALYPPGEVFWLRPLRSSTGEGAAGSSGGGGGGEGHELRRVRDVRFFDGIVLSPNMFTHHLLTNVMMGLEDTKSAGLQGGKR